MWQIKKKMAQLTKRHNWDYILECLFRESPKVDSDLMVPSNNIFVPDHK